MSIKKQSLKSMLKIFMKHQSGGTIHAHQTKIKLNSVQLGLWKRLCEKSSAFFIPLQFSLLHRLVISPLYSQCKNLHRGYQLVLYA